MEHLEKLTLQIENPPILGMFGMEEQRSVFMDIGAVLSMMFPMLGMNVFLIYGMRTEGNQAGTYVYSGIFMVVMSVNVFSFMDYDFQAIREEEKKGTSG